MSKSKTSKQTDVTPISIIDTTLDYNPIYKVNQIVNGKIDTIFVFNGKKNDTISQEELFNKIFTEEENDMIKTDKIKIKFSEQQIYFDDNIGTIKIKILMELKTQISLDEIYLYCQKIEPLNSIAIYQSLTQNTKIELTRVRLDQFISNVVNEENGSPITLPTEKDVYSLDDILEMKLDGKKYILNKVLGQKFFIVENEYPFVCDPFDIKGYDDEFFEKFARKSLSTLNSHLLLSSGNILNNNIYLCLAKDVLEYVSRKDISEETTIKIYYPFLHNKNINSLEELDDNRQKLVEGNKKFINEKTNDSLQTIAMFYDVYKFKKTNLNYVKKGIKFVKAVIKPEFEVKIPLELIFKIVHATQTNPLIKYNPSSKQENIYRLYTDKISTDGRKIPYLKKATIFKLMRNIGKTKTVAVYIEITQSNNNQTIICEFDENGFITITSEFQNIISEEEINTIFKDSINPIIEEITQVLEQSGYKLNKFNSLSDDNIEIKQLTYDVEIAIKKSLDIEDYKGCISAIFVDESSVFKKGIHLRFKRVSNFSSVSSQEAFILEKSEQGYRGEEIIELLIENFPDDLDKTKATELVRKVANEIQVERGVRKTDIKIKENPGFKTNITLNQETSVVNISVENINNINYLSTIPIYLDTMVRLTQDINSTAFPSQEIKKMCKKGIKEDITIPDIISSSEAAAEENEIPSIEDEEEGVEYTKYKTAPIIEGEKPKGAFSLFFDNSDEEELDNSEDSNKGGDIGMKISRNKNPNRKGFAIDFSGGKDFGRKGFNIDFSGGETESSDSSYPTDESSPKNTYNGVTVPTGISSDSDVPTDGSSPPLVLTNVKTIQAPKVLVKSDSDISTDDSAIPKTKKKVESLITSPQPNISKVSIIPGIISSSESESEVSSDTPTPESKVSSPEKDLSSLELEPTPPPSSSSEESVLTDVSQAPITEAKDKTPTPPSISDESVSTDVSQAPITEAKDKTPTPPSISDESVSTDVSQAPITVAKDKTPTPPSSSSEESVSTDVSEKVPEAPITAAKAKTPSLVFSEPKLPAIAMEKKKPLLKKKEVSISEGEFSEEEQDMRNIDNMKLNKPYYFQTLIEKKDPVLILKEDTAEYNAYSRTCRSDMRRQPVILTDTQLSKIQKDYPGFLKEEDVIKYGSNPKNPYNYICPQYWCLKTNTLIDPSELKEVKGKDGKKELEHPKCGKVLPKNEKKVKPGYYIYAFYGDDEKRYPGFQTDKHPDGYCLPCCFDKYNTEGRIKAKQKCYGEEQKKVEKQENIPPEEDEYIMGPDKFPLGPGRWGYLPGEIQKMLHEVNADCQISKTNTNIKQNHPCLLRHGVEINNKQSFVACISDAIFFGKKVIDEENRGIEKIAQILSIKEMRERIIKSLTIDSFIKYQNGNLVTDFQDLERKVDLNKFNRSKLFLKINMEKPEEKAYFTKVISAFENFVDFLSDDDAIIDHTYLWDIISMPNKYLFPNGVNLVIMQLPNDDITNNVQILCPTNHYSTEFYEARKPTIFLIKEDGYYEPIYSYTNENKKLTIAKEFKEYDPKLSKTMRAVLKEIIKPFLDTICKPLDSMPNVYKAKRAILLYDLVQKLDKYEYKILKLVLNFNNKVIGVLAQEPAPSEKKCMVPCYPSALDENLKKELDFVFMTDLSLWNTYYNTVSFLTKLEKRSKKRREFADIPCKPAFKIVEDELIVGILTETNQFIQISQPIPEMDIDREIQLPSINNDNYIVNTKKQPMIQIDIPISTETNVDQERVDYIKKIKLETSFYNVFRNTIRILLNDYGNLKIREKIEHEMLKEYIIYSEKLKNVNKLLRDLVKNKIKFIGDKNYYKFITEVSTCLVKDSDSCNASSKLCVMEDGNCNLILPEKNLITGKVNEPIYYGRLSDELIRYSRIKSFMLQPQTFLSFGNIGYNLRDNEIIMIQSLLTQEYFETLIPAVTNKYTKYNSYDEAEPIITQIYENSIPSLDHAIGRKNEKDCEKIIHNRITSSIWKECFPENYGEIEFGKLSYCTFNFIIDIIEKKTGNKLSINGIKNELFDQYKSLLPDYKDKIVDILIIEGKKTLGDQVLADTLTFSNFIYTDNYFLTTLDLWLLVNKYKIPTVFICQKFILQSKYTKHEFVGYGNEEDKFVFIVIPGFRPENIPGYKLIQSNDGDIFISLNKLNENCVDRIQSAIQNKISVEEYLEKFVKPNTSTYKKKKPAGLIIDSDSDQKERKQPKKKLIIEETSPITPEEAVPIAQKKQTKKKLALKGTQTKKNLKKRKLLIVESSSSEKI